MSCQAEELLGLLPTAGGHMLVEVLSGSISRQILALSLGYCPKYVSRETGREAPPL